MAAKTKKTPKTPATPADLERVRREAGNWILAVRSALDALRRSADRVQSAMHAEGHPLADLFDYRHMDDYVCGLERAENAVMNMVVPVGLALPDPVAACE